MSAQRDQQPFPATSIGRSHGARIQQTAANEQLAHPLLSDSTAQTRYVPYTPRQRPPLTVASGTTAHPPSPQQHQGDAASKLQLVNLKSAAQHLGLDSGSVGWSLLEKLVLEGDHSDAWAEVWSVVTTNKVTVLLPLEPASTHDKPTLEVIRDHIVLYDGSARSNVPFITLSGLRGTLDSDVLTFRSTLNTSSKLFQDILNPATRTQALAHLPPLPATPPIYPTYTLPSHSPSIPLPTHPPTKPPLPPRPLARTQPTPVSASPTPSTASRIPNPFASFFGHPKASPSLASTSTPSPPASLHSVEDPAHDSPQQQQQQVYIIPAFTIDRRIVRKDVGRQMNKALKSEVKSSLVFTGATPTPLPPWIAARVDELTAPWYPFVKYSSSPGRKRKQHMNSDFGAYIVNPFDEAVEELAGKVQEFYVCLEEDIKASGGGGEAEAEVETEKGEDEKGVGGEERVGAVLEVVERTICSLFYDRLFMHPLTDDASHDDALASRVAALNMLDLGLEHLDIVVGEDAKGEVGVVVRACGDLLTQLDECKSPGDKMGILVAAHKVVVDGLSRVPPIRLKSEHESVQTPDTAKPPLSKPDTPPDDDEPPQTLHLARPSTPTPVSGDVLLPLIIFSVVKSNPPHLVSNLLYTERFRNATGGEESYCLINMMAVAEFLENVDLKGLGLGESERVMSASELSPIPLTRGPPEVVLPLDGLPGSFRGKVEQQVDAIADSANKVITGVVDSSFGILRSFLPSGEEGEGGPKPGFGLLRRESGFSIASLKASLPITAGRTKSGEEEGQQLVPVSRPGSVRSKRSVRESDDESGTGDDDDEEDEEDEEGEEEDDDEEEEEEEEGAGYGVGDARSIRSFESMMSASKERRERRLNAGAGAGATAPQRKSLSDRLAHMSALAGFKGSPPTSHRSSALLPSSTTVVGVSSRAVSPHALCLGAPVQRFVDCVSVDELRVGDLEELLRDYKRIVEGVRSINGFVE